MSTDTYKVLETEKIMVLIKPKQMSEGQRILDIGGGGEGIISLLYTDKVVAIDKRLDELIEVNETRSLKIVMDATKLSFIDNQFERATAFFSFMYMSASEIRAVIKEVYRVLKPSGSFEIWDIEMPSINDVDEEIFIAQLEVSFNNHVITTGYGVKLKLSPQKMNQFCSLLTDCDFKISESKLDENGTFYIEAIKR